MSERVKPSHWLLRSHIRGIREEAERLKGIQEEVLEIAGILGVPGTELARVRSSLKTAISAMETAGRILHGEWAEIATSAYMEAHVDDMGKAEAVEAPLDPVTEAHDGNLDSHPEEVSKHG